MSTYSYGKKLKVASLDRIMLEDELWIRQHEKPSRNHGYRFFWKPNHGNRVFGFWILRSVQFFRKSISEIFKGFCTPLVKAEVRMIVSVWCSLHWVVDWVHVNEVTHTHFTAVNWTFYTLQLTAFLLHLCFIQITHNNTRIAATAQTSSN